MTPLESWALIVLLAIPVVTVVWALCQMADRPAACVWCAGAGCLTCAGGGR